MMGRQGRDGLGVCARTVRHGLELGLLGLADEEGLPEHANVLAAALNKGGGVHTLELAQAFQLGGALVGPPNSAVSAHMRPTPAVNAAFQKGRGTYDSERAGGEAGGTGGERGPVRRVDREALPERQDLGEQGSLLRVLACALLMELLASTRSDAREGLALGLAQPMQF